MNRICAVVITVLFLASSGASPAIASDPGNCSYRLVPISRGGSMTTADLDLVGCYATYEQAIEAGLGGAVDVPPDTTPLSLGESDLVAETATSDVLIGTEFNLVSYGGASASYFAPATCSASDSWEVNYVGDALNDYFSSGKGFGGCDHNKKFVDADFAGNVMTCTPNCTDYGTLSNQVSSLRWKP